VQSLIVINEEDTYVPTRWQATLLIFAAVLFVGGFNVFGAKHLPLAEGIFVSGHFGAFFPIMITILVLAPKRTAREVFLEFSDNGSGWPNLAWSTLVGQVSAMFCVLGKIDFLEEPRSLIVRD
jgi:choline transport protein